MKLATLTYNFPDDIVYTLTIYELGTDSHNQTAHYQLMKINRDLTYFLDRGRFLAHATTWDITETLDGVITRLERKYNGRVIEVIDGFMARAEFQCGYAQRLWAEEINVMPEAPDIRET